MTGGHDAARGAASRLAGDGVRLVRMIHSDLQGRARSKQLPVAELPQAAEGLGYCEASLVENLAGIPLEGGGFPADLGFPDVRAVADIDTARILPWEPDTAWVLADVIDGAEPSALCARSALVRATARLAAHGLEGVAAAEPEFYIVAPDPDRPGAPYSPRDGMAYSAGGRADPDGVFGRMHRALLGLGVGVTTANREFSPGQFEINLRHAPLLHAADHVFLLKEAVKELAMRDGLLATFMPKPRADAEGSSMHVHVSLWRDEANAFDAGDGGVTELCHRFIAGVLHHVRGLTAICAPSINSYKRLVPGGLAPVAAGLGGDDRLAYVRIPAERGRATRAEFRGGDASANPYLLLAGIVHAGLDGIERGLDLPAEPVPLPLGLEEATAALEADEVLVDGLGARLVGVLAALRREELDRYRRAVTDWEWREYGFHA